MKKFLKSQFPVFSIIAFALVLVSFINYQKPVWEVPAEYKSMKNPVKKTTEVMAEGKTLYDLHCASCHGPKGKGDGKKSEHLAKSPANLSLDEIQRESEGEYFYKIKIGRNGLHSYKSKLDDQETWTVIHYMHTFKQ